jgi:WD40 repeat protein
MTDLGETSDISGQRVPNRSAQVVEFRNTRPAGSRYDAFISYSHAQDGKLAPALQAEVERFAKPWYRSRARRVFRDQANLAASPKLWDAVEAELASSEWFVLLASPKAAQREWVEREVQWWLRNREADRILIVLTDGELAWDPSSGRVDAMRTTALPPSLVASLTAEPRWVDLRWMRGVDKIDPANLRFRDCIADIAAAVSGIPKDTLVGEHVRYQKRTRRLVGAVIASLTVLLAAALIIARIAVVQRNSARQQTLTATSRQLVAEATSIDDAQPDLARQLLVEAYRLAPTDQAVGALFASSSIPRVIPTRGSSRRVAYSPHRDVLAIASDEGVMLYDASTEMAMATLSGEAADVHAMVFSQDDQLLAVGTGDGNVRLWDVTLARHPKLLGSVRVPTGPLDALTFSYSARLLTVVGERATVVLSIHDPRHPVMTFTASLPAGLAVSPDGRVVASGSDGSTVDLWGLSKPSHPALLAKLDDPGSLIAFSPDGQLLAVGGHDDVTRLWDVGDPADPKQRASLTGQSLGIDAVAFSPDGTTLATGAGDGTIQLWNVTDPIRPTQRARLTGHTASIVGLAFSGDGHTLASASADGAALASDGSSKLNGTVRLWSVIGSERTAALAMLPSSGSSVPGFAPDSHTMAAGFPMTLWDLSDRAAPRALATVPTFAQGQPGVSFSSDGHTLASGVPVVLWDVTDRAHPRTLTSRAAVTDAAHAISFSPTAPVLVTETDAVRLWDVSHPGNPTYLSTLQNAHSGLLSQGLAFRRDGRILATPTGDGGVQLWDVARPSTPKLAGMFKPREGKIQALAFSPDGRTLLTGGSTGMVTAWDVRAPSHSRELASVSRHTGPVAGLAFHPGGTIAASASDDGTIRLWDVSDPSRPIEMTALSAGGLYDPAVLSFSPDGRTLAAASGHGLQLWDVDVDGILQRLCAQSPQITRTQWTQYLPDEPYDPPCA